jgi:hypothetical protein
VIRQHGAGGIASIATTAAIGIACLWSLIHLLPPLNGDSAAILYFADRMVSGDRLYVDLIDVNPPWIFWLNVAPAWIARELGASPATAFIVMVLAVNAAGLALARVSLRRLRALQEPFGATLVPLAALLALLVLPDGNFGQREHLMVALALPYLALSARRLQGDPPQRAEAVAVGVLAAVGFLIKPYYLAIPAVIEGALLVRRGWRATFLRPEPALLAVAAVGYLALALIFCPAYFSDVLPLVERYYLTPSLANALGPVFGVEHRWVGLLVLVPMAWCAVTARDRPALLVGVLFTTATAAIAAFQGKGWPYHLLPFWQGLLVTGAIFLAAMRRRLAIALGAPSLRLAAVGLFAVTLISEAIAHPPFDDYLDYSQSFAGRLETLLAPTARDRTVLWLTDAIYPHYPVALYDRIRPASRFMELWLIDSFYHGRRAAAGRPIMRLPAQMSVDERAVFNQIGTALERKRPALVLVASASSELGVSAGAFDYLGYFLHHPSFAREWRHYRQIATVDGTRIYERSDLLR